MPRMRDQDTPDYVVDVIDGAKPIGSQVAVTAVLLTMLLAAVSVVDAPMPRQDSHIDGARAQTEGPPAYGAGLLCLIGGEVREWIAVTMS